MAVVSAKNNARDGIMRRRLQSSLLMQIFFPGNRGRRRRRAAACMLPLTKYQVFHKKQKEKREKMVKRSTQPRLYGHD